MRMACQVHRGRATCTHGLRQASAICKRKHVSGYHAASLARFVLAG
jgi:hypothetical protein